MCFILTWSQMMGPFQKTNQFILKQAILFLKQMETDDIILLVYFALFSSVSVKEFFLGDGFGFQIVPGAHQEGDGWKSWTSWWNYTILHHILLICRNDVSSGNQCSICHGFSAGVFWRYLSAILVFKMLLRLQILEPSFGLNVLRKRAGAPPSGLPNLRAMRIATRMLLETSTATARFPWKHGWN